MRCYDHSTNVLLVSSLVIRDPFPDEMSKRTGAGLSPDSKADSQFLTDSPVSEYLLLDSPDDVSKHPALLLATIFDDLPNAGVTTGETQEEARS